MEGNAMEPASIAGGDGIPTRGEGSGHLCARINHMMSLA